MIEQRFYRIITILLLPIVINANNRHFNYDAPLGRKISKHTNPNEYNSYEEHEKPPSTNCESRPTTNRPSKLLVCPDVHKNIALKFSNLGLKRIGDYFVRSTDVISLHLDNNHIDHITAAAFQSLPRLETLDLSWNKLPRKNLLRLSNCANLRTLIINDNKLKSNNTRVPNDIIEPLMNLDTLQLQGHGIVKFEVSLRDFSPRLTHLDLSRNNLTSGTFLEYLPVTLTHLYLQENKIQSAMDLPTRDLVELLLDGNKIEQVCSDSCSTSSLSLKGATRLQKLQVSRNEISEITENAFQHAGSLSHLDLSQNQIRQLDNGTLNSLVSLEVFNISHNYLTVIPNVCALRYLISLDLSGNNIGGVFRDSLCNLSTLKTLKLNDNHITSIENYAFQRTDRLTDLDLSNNLLISLTDRWIVSPNSLSVLLLKNNSITKLEQLWLDDATSLKELHLQGNPLPRFDVNTLYSFPRSLSVHLKDAIRSLEVNEENESAEEEEEEESEEKDDEEKDEENDKDENSIDKSESKYKFF